MSTKYKKITAPEQLNEKLKTRKIDTEWDNTIQKFWWYHTNTENDIIKKNGNVLQVDPIMFKLRDFLLQFGGYEVCMPNADGDTVDIINRGQLWHKNFAFQRGLPSHCHSNSALLWKNDSANKRLCTGYALSEDGMWRMHSWCVEEKEGQDVVIETTEPRVGYFGFVLNNEEAEIFFRANV